MFNRKLKEQVRELGERVDKLNNELVRLKADNDSLWRTLEKHGIERVKTYEVMFCDNPRPMNFRDEINALKEYLGVYYATIPESKTMLAKPEEEDAGDNR